MHQNSDENDNIWQQADRIENRRDCAEYTPLAVNRLFFAAFLRVDLVRDSESILIAVDMQSQNPLD